MKKTFKIIFISLIGLSFFYFFYLKDKEHRELTIKSNEVIQLIEKYKSNSGEFPKKLEEIGLKSKESGPIYYKKLDDNCFEIWYVEGFDKTYIYNSKDKNWKTSFN